MPANRRDRGVMSNRFGTKSRKRSKRAYAVETLESRTLLAYTFTYVPATHTATAQGDGATDGLVISPIGGLLEHSVNGGAFDSNWTGFTVPAAVTETVDVNTDDRQRVVGQARRRLGSECRGPRESVVCRFRCKRTVEHFGHQHNRRQ